MLSSPWSRACKCGPAPGAAAGASALVCRLADPRAGLGRSQPAGSPAPLRPPRSLRPLATPEPPHRPLPGSASSHLTPHAVPKAGPQSHTFFPRGLSIFVPFHPRDPELRQEESCSVIVFTVSFPSSRILWDPHWSRRTPPPPPRDTQSLGTHPPYPTCCLPFLLTFSSPPFWALPCFQNLLLLRQDLGTLHRLLVPVQAQAGAPTRRMK